MTRFNLNTKCKDKNCEYSGQQTKHKIVNCLRFSSKKDERCGFFKRSPRRGRYCPALVLTANPATDRKEDKNDNIK